MTLFRRFKSGSRWRFLELREERWMKGWLQARTPARAAWRSSTSSRMISSATTSRAARSRGHYLECDEREDPVRQACVEHLRGHPRLPLRAGLGSRCRGARAVGRWRHMLMTGARSSPPEGDLDAAAKAREVGTLMLGARRPRGARADRPVRLPRGDPRSAGSACWRLTGELDAESAATVAAVVRQALQRSAWASTSSSWTSRVCARCAARTAPTRSRSRRRRTPCSQLIGVLGWDSDPGVELRLARAA